MWSDQFLVSSADSAESLLGREARGKFPKPLRVTLVGAIKLGGADLRAGWSAADLSVVGFPTVGASGFSLAVDTPLSMAPRGQMPRACWAPAPRLQD